MVSKELLSEVLECNISHIITDIQIIRNKLSGSCGDNEIAYYDNKWNYLNIYELANKVKEWARYYYSVSSYPTYFGYGAKLTDSFGNSPKNLVISKKTEPEAIFRAGEFILKELNNG